MRDWRRPRMEVPAGAGVNAPPASYTVDGSSTSWSAPAATTQLDYKRGNSIIAFTVD